MKPIKALIAILILLGLTACPPTDPPADLNTLNVTKRGTGSGTVTSNPNGINCGGDCEGNYSEGTAVVLTANPDTGSTFTEWGGACASSGSSPTCRLEMTTNRSVIATFTGTTDPSDGTDPISPDDATDPASPDDTTDPTSPDDATDPTSPDDATDPTSPDDTTDPTSPDDATDPTSPDDGTDPTDPTDPGDGNLVIALAADSDDAEEYTTNGSFGGNPLSAGTVDVGSSDLELNYDKNFSLGQLVGLRFTGIEIPEEATVTDAYIRFTRDNNGDSGSPTLSIRAQADGDLATFVQEDNNISNRSLSAAAVTWTPGEFDATVRTPNLASLLPEISDGTIVFVISGDGSTGQRTAESGTAELVIELESDDPEQPAPTGVSINEDDRTIEVGETADYTATVAPTGANQRVSWSSSDTAIATVDGNGTVRGVAEGSATITATSTVDGSLSDNVTVTVTPATTPPTVNSVTIDQEDPSVEVDSTVTLTATVDAEGGAAETVTWSSGNEAVATVNASGVVSGVAVGTAEIMATSTVDTSKLDSVTVTVTAEAEPAVNSVTVTPETVSVAEGNTAQLSVTVDADEGADTTVTWSSSNEAVATVSSTGLVTAQNVDADTDVTVTATSNGDGSKSDSAVVTVTNNPPAVSGVTVTPETVSVEEGNTTQLTVTVQPESANQGVTWSSSNDAVATVDTSGLVTALAVDSDTDVTITATSVEGESIQDSAVVTVTATPPAINSVTVSPEAASVAEGSATQLTATVDAEAGADESVTWSSSNEAVATVDATGLVTALTVDSDTDVTITATSDVDESKSDSAVITVTDIP